METFKTWLPTTTQVLSLRIVTKVWEKETHSSAGCLTLICFPANCTCRKHIPSLALGTPLNTQPAFSFPHVRNVIPEVGKMENWPGSNAHSAPAELPGTRPLHNSPKAPLPALPSVLAERHRHPRPLPLAQPSCGPLGKMMAKFLNRKPCLKTKPRVSGKRGTSTRSWSKERWLSVRKSSVWPWWGGKTSPCTVLHSHSAFMEFSSVFRVSGSVCDCFLWSDSSIIKWVPLWARSVPRQLSEAAWRADLSLVILFACWAQPLLKLSSEWESSSPYTLETEKKWLLQWMVPSALHQLPASWSNHQANKKSHFPMGML